MSVDIFISIYSVFFTHCFVLSVLHLIISYYSRTLFHSVSFIPSSFIHPQPIMADASL